MIRKTGALFIVIAVLLGLSACGGPRKFFGGPGHQDFAQQLTAKSDASVLSVQGYVIKSLKSADHLTATWQEMAALMKQKPGFIEADLSPGVGESVLWIETSKWQNSTYLRAAFSDPKVQLTAQKLPKVGMSHLFELSAGGRATKEINALK